MTTRVVNLYKDEFDVYVGRSGHGQDGTFGNPFNGPNRDENIVRFKDYFHNRIKTDPAFRKKVHELKDKTLGCFCKPKNCHGDIIADYLNSLPETKPCKLAVVGSRSFNDYAFMCDILQWYEISLIISGGARGADSLVEKYALDHGIPKKVFPAEWDKYGKRAGFLRNEKIVETCDEVVAFMDINNPTPGTQNTITLAEKAGKPVSVFWPEKTECIDSDEDEDDFLMKVGLHRE